MRGAPSLAPGLLRRGHCKQRQNDAMSTFIPSAWMEPARRLLPPPRVSLLCLALALSAALSSPALAQTADKPYTVEIWSDATFGPDGKLQKLEVVDAATQPAAFVERVKKQLASARIPPVVDGMGQPATFETGVRVKYLVTPAANGGTVRMTGMDIEPRPLKRYLASQPEGVPADTPLNVRLSCNIDTAGECKDPKVLGADGTYAELRRWGVASLQGWRFAPQRINGQAVPTEVEVTVTLTIDNYRPADFRNPLRIGNP